MGGHDVVADPAALRAAAEELDVVASQMEEHAIQWVGHRVRQRLRSPGADPVSVQLLKNMITMGERAGFWMADYARQLRVAQQALQAQADAYERAEREAADRLKGL